MESPINQERNLIKDDKSQNHPAAKLEERGQWSNKMEYIFSVAGAIVGLGNVWRFPYLCFKNGGGAFLVPYILFLFLCGIPIFFLEVSLGQLTSQGGVKSWRKICPLMKGLGYGSQVVSLYNAIHYIVILAWALVYLVSSFSTELPWAHCNNTWNTENCADYGEKHSSKNQNLTSSAEEFWQRRILGLSGGIDELGSLRWDLAGCLLLIWIVCFFSVWKGIKSSGKVAYFTASFPYVMMIILLIHGLTLPGAMDGIRYYLTPDPSRLADSQVWMDAGSQIFYSYAVCIGCLISMGSYNRYNNNCYRDAFGMCLLNSLTSFVAGFAVFPVLGFMAHELGVHISVVAKSGPGLAFIVFPRAVALMPLPQLWAVFFFMMILFLGLDSEGGPAVILDWWWGVAMVVGVRNRGQGGLSASLVHSAVLEGLITSITDIFPSLLIGHRRKLLLLAICLSSFFIGLFMVTEGGLYVFLLFDYYACSGIPLITFGILESITIAWIYGADRYANNVMDMIGYRPWPYMKYCWRFIAPCLCTVVLLLSLINFTPLKYNNTYQYPWWGYAFGILLAISSVIMVPLWVLYSVAVTPGTLRQRLKVLTTPSDDLLRSSVKRSLHSETSPSSKELEMFIENN